MPWQPPGQWHCFSLVSETTVRGSELVAGTLCTALLPVTPLSISPVHSAQLGFQPPTSPEVEAAPCPPNHHCPGHSSLPAKPGQLLPQSLLLRRAGALLAESPPPVLSEVLGGVCPVGTVSLVLTPWGREGVTQSVPVHGG